MPLLADPLDFPADAEPSFAEGLRTVSRLLERPVAAWQICAWLRRSPREKSFRIAASLERRLRFAVNWVTTNKTKEGQRRTKHKVTLRGSFSRATVYSLCYSSPFR